MCRMCVCVRVCMCVCTYVCMHTSIHIQMYYERKHSDTSCIEILRFLVTVGHVTQYMWVWCAKVLLLRQAASSWQQARLDTLVRSPTPSGLPSPNLHNAIEGEKSTPLCGHCLGQKVAPNEINRNNAGVLGTASHFFFLMRCIYSHSMLKCNSTRHWSACLHIGFHAGF